jgi:hypothetical protein
MIYITGKIAQAIGDQLSKVGQINLVTVAIALRLAAMFNCDRNTMQKHNSIILSE